MRGVGARWQRWKAEPFRLAGGLNEVDPEVDLKAGTARTGTVNYECTVSGSPRRMEGYERFDGRPSPSAELFYKITFQAGGPTPIAVGNTVTGSVTGATGKVMEVTLTFGSWGSSSAAGDLIISRVTGSFSAADNLLVAAAYRADATTPAIQAFPVWPLSDDPISGYIDTNYKAHKRLVEADRRADILAVPGSGPIRGVWYFNDIVYAFRDNLAATACVMHKSTAAGWSPITLKNEISFTVGNGTPPADGATITQGAVNAVVRRTCLQSGDWGLGTAAGRFIIDNPTGGNFVAGAFTAGVTATASGVQTAITIAPGGAYDFVNHNFYGATDKFRMYGADGKNRAFEFGSDDIYAPIKTGMTTDTPDHIEVHRDYLFLSFPGGSIQNAGVGNPHGVTVRTGAGEFGIGDDCTGMKSVRGSVLAIMGRKTAHLLYGTGVTDWNLKPWLAETGAMPFCLQEVTQQVFAFDESGGYFVEATQTYGDFKPSLLTRVVDNTVVANGSLAVGILLVRDKGQVRIFFADTSLNGYTGLVGTFVGPKLIGWMPFATPHRFVCFASGKSSAGVERLFAGVHAQDNGYVMEMDSGTNHDGTAIASTLSLVASDQRAPNNSKRYHEIEFDVKTAQDLTLTLTTEIVDTPETLSGSYTEVCPGSTRNSRAQFRIEGEGQTLAPSLAHSDDIEPAFTVMVGRVKHTIIGAKR